MAEQQKQNSTPSAPSANEQEGIDQLFGAIRPMLSGGARRYAKLNKLTLKDLNNNPKAPTFNRYSKEDIMDYLSNPYSNEKQLRSAVVYMYGASSHFRRLIQYFVGLSDLSYVISPYNIDTSTANPEKVRKNYLRTLKFMNSLNIKDQGTNILTVCLREDTYYATTWISNDDITIQQLPSDYCKISTIEGGVLNVTFNFAYFDQNKNLLEYYPKEFENKYNLYKTNGTKAKWQELDSPTSFAIKCNKEILDYSLPPFAGILTNLYEIEDYKLLKLTKTELENYALLVMKLGMDKEGNWAMDFGKAKQFWENLDSVLPEEVGSVLTPMDIDKISFDEAGTSSTDKVSESEDHLMSAAGVSSQIFSSKNTSSSNAMLLSIKADQAITFGIVKSIEAAINRILQSQSWSRDFRVTFLDCSPFNRIELAKLYREGAMYGLPTVSLYCAAIGIGQSEMDTLNYLEDNVLGIKDRFVPLQSSNTMSSGGDDGGRPEKDVGDISDEGEKSKESNTNR